MILVCPACRRVEGGALRVETLEARAEGLRCACGRVYPVVDGIPIVLRDLAGWMASEGPELLRRQDLAPEVSRALAHGAGGALSRNQDLLDVYAAAPASAWTAWLAETVAGLARPVIEVGAGLGHPDTLAMDLNFALLRARGGGIVGDAADPPFLAECAESVVIANVLDSCADPGLVLAQSVALLRPGGTLVVGCAYAFAPGITTRGRWFGEADLRAAMGGSPFFGHRLPLTLVDEVPALEWRLPVGARSEHVHRVHALVARKLR